MATVIVGYVSIDKKKHWYMYIFQAKQVYVTSFLSPERLWKGYPKQP